jgi:hypothetical protein
VLPPRLLFAAVSLRPQARSHPAAAATPRTAHRTQQGDTERYSHLEVMRRMVLRPCLPRARSYCWCEAPTPHRTAAESRTHARTHGLPSERVDALNATRESTRAQSVPILGNVSSACKHDQPWVCAFCLVRCENVRATSRRRKPRCVSKARLNSQLPEQPMPPHSAYSELPACLPTPAYTQ